MRLSAPIVEILIRSFGPYLVGKEARLVAPERSEARTLPPEAFEAEAFLTAVIGAPWYRDPFTACSYLTEEQLVETARDPTRYAVHGPFPAASLHPTDYEEVDFRAVADGVRGHTGLSLEGPHRLNPDPEAVRTHLDLYLGSVASGKPRAFRLLPRLAAPEDTEWEAYLSPLYPTQLSLDLFESWVTYSPGTGAVHLLVVAAD